MKRIFAIFLVFILALCTAGCTSTAELKGKLNARVTRGTIDGNTYTSEFTELTFTKPDHWRYLTDEELSSMLNISIESMDANVFEKSAMEYSNILDMRAINDATGQNVTIGYENLSLTVGRSVSEEEYLEATTRYLETMGDAKCGEPQIVQLCGYDYLKSTFAIEVDGNQITTVYYMRCIGDIMTIITVASPQGIIDKDIESMFG